MQRACTLFISIARQAPEGPAANLAMQAMSEAQALRRSDLPLRPDEGKLAEHLQRLRQALEAAKSALQRDGLK